MLGTSYFFISAIFITTFALRAKRAHVESVCCLQCISHVTIEQNIHKGNEVNRNGWTRKKWLDVLKKHNISIKIIARNTRFKNFYLSEAQYHTYFRITVQRRQTTWALQTSQLDQAGQLRVVWAYQGSSFKGVSLFQNESSSKTFLMKTYSYVNGLARSLVMKQKLKATRKWPIRALRNDRKTRGKRTRLREWYILSTG